MKTYKYLIVLSALLALAACRQTAEREMNLFIGTAGDHGQVSPGAAVPFGMVYLCPDSDPANHAGYDYDVPRISGISVNRIDGVGCTGTGGNVNVRPALPDEELKIVKGSETAIPGYYAADLDNGVRVELTTTGNVGAELYTFPEGKKPEFFIDFAKSFAYSVVPQPVEYGYEPVGDHAIQGTVRGRNVGDDGWYRIFFHMDFSTPFTIKEQTPETVTLEMAAVGKPVEIRIGLSSLSTDDAKILVDDAAGRTFEEIRSAAAGRWDELLGAVTVQGGTADQRTIFYTSLYRCCLTPHNVTSTKGEYLGTDGKTYTADGFTYYSSWSIWDTFRTKFPLFSLLYPSLQRDFCESMMRVYRTGLFRGSSDYEATPTVRTEHMTVVILDALVKGVPDLSVREYYEDLKREAVKRIDQKYSADYIIETTLDLWAMSSIAGILGKEEDETWFKEQAESIFRDTWTREFKDIDASFLKVEDNGLYEGTRWQYRWAMPQYLPMMEELHGRERLLEELTYFFDHDLYNQGNEPDIQVPYLFNRLGAPERAQKTVRKLLTEDMIHRYGTHQEFEVPYFGKTFKNDPEGFIPEMDEDDGTMSGWYVFSSMGLYPVIVGSEEYELVSPIFDRVDIRLENGREVRIRTKGRRSPDDIIRKITWNGREITDYRITHGELLQGGELVFRY